MRFQTRIAELLERETGKLQDYTSISWSALGKKIGVSSNTVKRWHATSVGSDEYLNTIDGEALGKFARYFGVGPDQIIVVVYDSDETGDDFPQQFQESAFAATMIAA